MSDITHALKCLDYLVRWVDPRYEDDVGDNAKVIRNLIDRTKSMRSILQRRNNDGDDCIACGVHNKYEKHKADCVIFPEENQ